MEPKGEAKIGHSSTDTPKESSHKVTNKARLRVCCGEQCKAEENKWKHKTHILNNVYEKRQEMIMGEDLEESIEYEVNRK